MALKAIYTVCRMDGTGYKIFHRQDKAEEYGRSLKHSEAEQIMIKRVISGGAPYVYYI
jgi:hypothetical protein